MGTTKTRILWVAGGIAICVLAAVVIFLKSPDPLYALKEVLFRERYHRYDILTEEIGAQYDIDPNLLRAVIWQESRFQPNTVGKHGERGLMQVMEIAANEWAQSEKINGFQLNDLFDPKTNIQAGAWRLSKALRHWSKSDNPVPFALAEYNAGRSRVVRWTADPVEKTHTTSAEEMKARMDFPTTRAYINAILERYEYYKTKQSAKASREPAEPDPVTP
ncbi:MAG: lytic transglycosylase domain-containing protein [Chthoniobacterales bacterium]